jgi:hypothetical protein
MLTSEAVSGMPADAMLKRVTQVTQHSIHQPEVNKWLMSADAASTCTAITAAKVVLAATYHSIRIALAADSTTLSVPSYWLVRERSTHHQSKLPTD